jgi:hypothetical protein
MEEEIGDVGGGEITTTFILTLNIVGDGTVTINDNLYIEPVELLDAEIVTLVASASEGSVFVQYDSALEESPITTSSYTFNMPPNNLTITVTFGEDDDNGGGGDNGGDNGGDDDGDDGGQDVPVIGDVGLNGAGYDTNCPIFILIKDLKSRFFAGDIIDLSEADYTQIIEPINFDTGTFKLERDNTYHGFNYEFGVSSLQCEIGTDGYDFIKNQLYLGGTDSDVKFIYGFGVPDSLSVFYIGKIDFNTIKEIEDGEKIEFELVELDFDNLLQTAFEVPQEIDLTLPVSMFSKVLPKRVEYKIEVPESQFNLGGGLSSRAWFGEDYRTPNLPNEDIEAISRTSPPASVLFNSGRQGDGDFERFFSYDFQVTSEDVSAIIDNVPNLPVFIATEAGRYIIDVKFWMGLFFVNPLSFTSFDYITLVVETNTFLSTYTARDIITPTLVLDPNKILEFNEQIVLDVAIDEPVYIYVFIDTSSSSFPNVGSISAITPYPFRYDTIVPQLSIVGETFAPSSTTNVRLAYDVMNEACQKAIEDDSYDVVVSNYFKEGCGRFLSLTNGFNVRGLTDKGLKVSPKSLIDGVRNLMTVGFGIEYNDDKREIVRVEPFEYFYQDNSILEFNNVSNFTKEVDSSQYYNEVEVGFKVYSKQRETDKGFTLDDIHTKHFYQTPIKTNKNKLSIITDIIMSAHTIEILRRKQFENGGANVNGNFSEDEELFGIMLTNTQPTTTFNFGSNVVFEDSTLTTINGEISLTLNAGEVISYTSTNGVVQNRTVLSFDTTSFDVLGTLVTLNFIFFVEPLVGGSGSGGIVIERSGVGELRPEGSQAFEVVNSILSPATTYNLRFSPKRILLNWMKVLNGGFFGKAANSEVLFKQGDGNVAYESKFNDGEECLLGDLDRGLIVEGANVGIDLANKLFVPIKVSFSAPLSFEELIYLKKCLRGVSSDNNNYGYVLVKDGCGVDNKVYLTSVEYNGRFEECSFEGYLKEI